MSEIFDVGEDTQQGIEKMRQSVHQGGTLQQVRTSYTTAVAVQRPRNLKEVERRVIEEARIAGGAFYYGWGAGKDRIEGPSKELAMTAVRCWGNCAVELDPVQETTTAWIFTAAFIDLETGFTSKRQFRQSKGWQVYGKFDAERKDDIRFQIGQTKAIRNVVLNSLPASIVNKAMEVAKAGVREKIAQYIDRKGAAHAREVTLAELKKLGVGEAQVLAKLGRSTVAGLELEDLVLLSGDIEVLRAGAETPEALFPPATPKEGEGGEGKSKSQAMQDSLKEKEQGEKPEPEPEPKKRGRKKQDAEGAQDPPPEQAAEAENEGDEGAQEAQEGAAAEAAPEEATEAQHPAPEEATEAQDGGTEAAPEPVVPPGFPENLPARVQEFALESGAISEALREFRTAWKILPTHPQAVKKVYEEKGAEWGSLCVEGEARALTDLVKTLYAVAKLQGYPQE